MEKIIVNKEQYEAIRKLWNETARDTEDELKNLFNIKKEEWEYRFEEHNKKFDEYFQNSNKYPKNDFIEGMFLNDHYLIHNLLIKIDKLEQNYYEEIIRNK